MTWVYLLRSLAEVSRTYVGRTGDVNARLKFHNSGRSPYTARYRPWTVVAVIGFSEEPRAIAFEKYVKTGSGRAFALRHFW